MKKAQTIKELDNLPYVMSSERGHIFGSFRHIDSCFYVLKKAKTNRNADLGMFYK